MWMAEAKDRYEWNRTFALLAQTYNLNRGPKTKALPVMQFFPWPTEQEKPKPRKLTPEERHGMRELLPPKDAP